LKGKTLVLGASLSENRYSNRAIIKLRAHGHLVLALGLRSGVIGDVTVLTELHETEGIDTITLYMNSQRQPEYYNLIEKINPGRIIFNPGAENDELFELALNKNWGPVEACTLVMLATGQY
jgi:uncharacterized protein